MTAEVSILEYLTAPDATISVGRLASYANTLLMTWQQDVRLGDVSNAFKAINSTLDNTDNLLYVIVDIRSQPKFPMAETIFAAVRGPYRHPKMAAWLVIGDNRVARMIGTTVSNIARRNNIEWFESMQSALDSIGHQSEETA
jgi:hypothetical protein